MPLARVQATIIRQLASLGKLSEEQAEQIIQTPEEMSGEAMEQMLLKDHNVSEFLLLVAKGNAFQIAPFNARHYKADERTFERLDQEFCQENKVLPIGVAGEYIIIALANPFNISLIQKIQDKTRLKVSALLALEKDIESKFKSADEGAPAPEDLSEVTEALGMEMDLDDEDFSEDDVEEEDAPIVQLANRIIENAYYAGGSDIHIDPMEKDTRIRVRIDGVCQETLRIPRKASSALIARLKVMSNLDIAEKRLPQDGRIVFKQFNKKNIDIDLRLSTAPLNHGEGCVMRILDKQKSTLPLPALGYSEKNLTLYRDLIQRPYGMILHCGPTGSGKSMTLYSALNEINTPDTVIRTAEDPIEYTLPGICQMQMHKKIGLTFASALRAYLRQDPDIILVGEIRDTETAHIAVEAALTGHLLFSTLHTNDAPGTIARLTEMDIEPFMISASLICVCAQRLMRRVCKSCKQPYLPEGNEAEIFKAAVGDLDKIFRANEHGCPACSKGYKGRVGIHELMATSEELVKGINAGLESAQLKAIAVRNGMHTLHRDSMLKVGEGISTMEEAIATVPPDMEDMEAMMKTLPAGIAG